MSLKLVKFGGSSLSDAGQFKKVKEIVSADKSRRVVVVSAPGKRSGDDNKITDLLYLCHAHLQYGVNCDNVFSMIVERYQEIAKDCGLKTDLDAEFAAIRGGMSKHSSMDELASRGEYLNARLMADYLGYTFLDAKDWLFFGYDGKVDYEKTNEALQKAYTLHDHLVLPGFYGVTPDGKIKTFPRGGSDITGAIAAAALDADVYENWTDVPGILMADPRIVKNPKSIERITFAELRELSYMGASVLHEETVFPVRSKDIPLNIRDTNDPRTPGTMIRERFDDELEEERARFITGISGKKHYSILSMSKTRMSEDGSFIRKVLDIAAKYSVIVEHIPSGIDSASLVFSTKQAEHCLYDLLTEIKKECQPDSLKVTEGISLIAVVGRRMAWKPGISGRLFATLGDNEINIRMIEQGADEINIIVGVEDKDFAKTIQVLYNSFT